MVVQNGFRPITWNAETCRFSETDVYLGLAPGLEEFTLAKMFGPAVLARYPADSLPIASNGVKSETVPLRLYALRDPEVCTITRNGNRSPIAGFKRVKLHFNPAAANGNFNMPSTESSGHTDLPPVVAFVMTIGLSLDQERSFFEHIVNDLIKKSWSSLPDLLREVGCASSSAA